MTDEERTPNTVGPLKRDELDQLLADDLAALDDEVRAQWLTIAIEPEKWRCSPWSDESDGFWVVAICHKNVVWYNEIEEGFNVSTFSSYGTIATYSSEQHTIGESLASSGIASPAESLTEVSASRDIPDEINGDGRIEKRQTTYWGVRSEVGHWKIHFSDRKESKFVRPEFKSLAFAPGHPLLSHYREDWEKLCVSARTNDASSMLQQLEAIVLTSSNGFRRLSDYLNGSKELASLVLEQGYGCVLEGPESIVLQSKRILQRGNLRPSVVARYRIDRGEALRLLFLGENWIIARNFRFEAV